MYLYVHCDKDGKVVAWNSVKEKLGDPAAIDAYINAEDHKPDDYFHELKLMPDEYALLEVFKQNTAEQLGGHGIERIINALLNIGMRCGKAKPIKLPRS